MKYIRNKFMKAYQLLLTNQSVVTTT